MNRTLSRLSVVGSSLLLAACSVLVGDGSYSVGASGDSGGGGPDAGHCPAGSTLCPSGFGAAACVPNSDPVTLSSTSSTCLSSCLTVDGIAMCLGYCVSQTCAPDFICDTNGNVCLPRCVDTGGVTRCDYPPADAGEN